MSDEDAPLFERMKTKKEKCEDMHRNQRLIARGTKKRHRRKLPKVYGPDVQEKTNEEGSPKDSRMA